MIDGNLAMNSHFENMSEKDTHDAIDNMSLIKLLQDNGYYNLINVPDRGVCGLQRMLFTTGLFYNLNEYSCDGRYCFENAADAKEALNNWNGTGDPEANWIKHKGRSEYNNPNYQK